jgi:hypothetical protein
MEKIPARYNQIIAVILNDSEGYNRKKLYSSASSE